MGRVVFWIIITIAVIIIIYKIIRVLMGKTNSCSGCSYRSNCTKTADVIKKK